MEKETGRLEAFSDGVFAIAMTLLVLELKVPHATADGEISASALGGRLLREWPSYLALITSFFTVLIIWVHHHILFKLVRKVDAKLLFANGFLLLLVSMVPFPTAVVAEYLATPAAPAACEFYADVFVLISIAFYVLMTAAVRAIGLRSASAPGANTAAPQELRTRTAALFRSQPWLRRSAQC